MTEINEEYFKLAPEITPEQLQNLKDSGHLLEQKTSSLDEDEVKLRIKKQFGIGRKELEKNKPKPQEVILPETPKINYKSFVLPIVICIASIAYSLAKRK